MSNRAIRLGDFLNDDGWDIWTNDAKCPKCKWSTEIFTGYVYCPNCGKKLKKSKSMCNVDTVDFLERAIKYALEENT